MGRQGLGDPLSAREINKEKMSLDKRPPAVLEGENEGEVTGGPQPQMNHEQITGAFNTCLQKQ